MSGAAAAAIAICRFSSLGPIIARFRPHNGHLTITVWSLGTREIGRKIRISLERTAPGTSGWELRRPRKRGRATPACYQDGVVSEIDRLRNRAEHVRWLARWIADQRAEEAFEDLANDLDRQVAEIERQQAVEEDRRAISRSDTP